MRRRLMRRRLVTMVVLAALLLVASRPSWAKESSDTYGREAGYGTLAALSTMVYGPLKMVYSLLGGFTGGLAYLVTVGDLETAEKVWSVSMGGTYVVTPGMLRGEEEFLVNGATHEKE